MDSPSSLAPRLYQTEADYWRIREFLRRVYRANGRRQRSWDIARFDYWRWHGIENIAHLPLAETVCLWEDRAGEIGAVLTPEGPQEAFLHIHPAWRSLELAQAMLAEAELRLAGPAESGRRRLQVWANEQEPDLGELLLRRGYARSGVQEAQRRRSLDEPIPEGKPAPGYRVRPLGDETELPARSWLSWLAFHPNAPAEDYEGWQWYRNIQRCPLYRRDLDLVAVCEADGELAAFCTIWFDDCNRMAIFEPVGTAPAHQRRGLARALISEGLRRLQRLGAAIAHVGSYSAPAHAAYAALGFTDFEWSASWIKEW